MSRYSRQRLPRYTSYPTAPQFGAQVTEENYRSWLSALPADVQGSVYLHVPYCRSMCWYCGCHTTITHRDEPISDYVDTLLREMDMVAQSLTKPLHVGHVHFGGGTPTILTPELFAHVMGQLRRHFHLREDAEIAVEIDPRTLTPQMTETLGACGVTRASLGVQTFDPKVQKAINRIQSFETVTATVERLRSVGIGNINLDLIYGLPLQTTASCVDTVNRALLLKPQRFSVFGYAHVPTFKKHQRKIDSADLPDAEERRHQEEAIAETLLAAGYRRIGLDHYTLPEDSMALALANGTLRRNFQGYTTDTSEALIGLGASAIGQLPQGYLQNEVHLLRYARSVAEGRLPIAKGYVLTDEDRLRADLIERIMCDFRVDMDRVLHSHGHTLQHLHTIMPQLQQLEGDGVIRMSGSVIEVSNDARPLVRTVAAAFDAYLNAANTTHAPAV